MAMHDPFQKWQVSIFALSAFQRSILVSRDVFWVWVVHPGEDSQVVVRSMVLAS